MGIDTVKTIGLIGGMSWESSAEYYRIINETTKARLGGLHSAKSILYSVDFAEVEALQHQDRWSEAADLMVAAARALERAGADLVVLCTNTMHKLAPAIEASIAIPLLHIADATAAAIQAHGLQRVGLLGTQFTMEQDFYQGRLTDRHKLEVLVPNLEERQTVHRIIYQELCLGVINADSRSQIVTIIQGLTAAGAEGIILGCTELELLVRPQDTAVCLFPTTRIHGEAAVAAAVAPQ